MKRVYKQIIEETNNGGMTKASATKIIKSLRALEDEKQEIAIIGMAATYPAAKDVNLFWNNIRNGNDYFIEFPQSRKRVITDYLKKKDIGNGKDAFIKGAFLDDIDSFDCQFFHITPNDADHMDPNQRLFLQNVYHTIEDAGYMNTIHGTRTGIYVGFSNDLRNKYLEFISELDSKSIPYSVGGNLESIIPSRVSFFKDLKGPAVLVDSACSSSLVALHLACEAIRKGECDQAIAGGIMLNLLPLKKEGKIGIESSDEKTRSFDRDSDGTGIGEGIASVMIKPFKRALADNDYIYAVIKGSAVNQDGNSSGITAPNVNSQEDVLIRAWENAKINPEELGFIECHGTATQLGDTIEIEALTNAFKKFTNNKQFCGISATKSNIGHLYEASGITGVIKAVLCLKNKQIPQIANFNVPNHKINFENSPLYVIDKLTDWKKESYHRICGVSSFGFSGTNCHMVLEEAPEEEEVKEEVKEEVREEVKEEVKQEVKEEVREEVRGEVREEVKEEVNTEHDNTRPHIFTLSAKSKESLLQYIQDYKKYLLSSVKYSIREICGNTNCCKEQFQHRVAILSDSKADLYNKLNRISEDKLEGEDIFYGMPNVVYEISKIQSGSDITVSRQQELTEQAEAVIASMQNNDKDTDTDAIKHKLEELAKLYVAGGVIKWNTLYQSPIRKAPMPLYPFAKESHWVNDRDNEEIAVQNKQKALHPLVGQLIAELVDEDVYMSRLSPLTHFVLRDHIVLGMNVIAGATHLETLRYIGWRYFDTNRFQFNKLEFQMPVFCDPDSFRDVYISVKHLDDGVFVTVCSKDDNQEVITHLTCEVKPSYEEEAEILPIQEYIDHSTEMLRVNQNDFTKGFIKFSNNWLTYKALYKTEEYMIGELELAEEFHNELEAFYLHPGLLDLGINSFSVTIGKRYLPFSFENVKIYGPTPSHFYSFTRYKGVVTEGETIYFNVKLADDSGKVFLETNNYVMKKVHSFKRLLQPNHFYSQLELEEAGRKSHAAVTGKTIAIAHGKESPLFLNLMQQLTCHGNAIIDSDFSMLESDYEGENAQSLLEGQYKILVEQWISQGAHTILYVLDGVQGLYEAEKLEYNCHSMEQLFLLMKALEAVPGEEQIKLFVIGQSDYGDDTTINPYHYASYTLGKVFAKEQGKIQIKSVELDTRESILELLCEMNEALDTPLVIYRKGIRYIEQYAKLNMEELPERDFIIREEGAYVITGGSGGIGLVMAEYLSNKQKVNLCLLGRTILPGKEDWNEAVNKGDNAKLARLIEIIGRMERRGSKVDYIACDVTEFHSLNQAITEIRKRYGKINGVMHCAGLPGDGYIIDKKLSEFRRIIQPKIHGTVLLHELTKPDHCDFFLLCSSIASVMALPSQSDYSAANAFMDCFAKLNEKDNMVSISWPAWNDLGMAADNNAVFDTLFQTMSSKDAVYNMEQILSHHIGHVILGKWVYNEQFYEMVNLNVSKEIKSLFMKQRESKKGRIHKREQDIILQGRGDNAYTPLERKLGLLWGKVLGYRELNIYDSFYELGGDSILAVRLNNEINNKFSMTIRISELFDHMTIYDFAGYLEGKMKQTDRAESGLKINKAEKRAYYPVTSGQKRMYFAALSMDNDTLYNIPMIFEILGEVDITRLVSAFKELVKRQASLRTGFCFIDGNLMQYVNENPDFDFESFTCETDTITDILPRIIRSFHLEEAALFRAGLIEANGGRKYLFMDIHHVISDGYSLMVLVNDLIAIYNKSELEELTISYTDFAVWENEKITEGYFRAQQEYWLRQLKDMPEPVNLNYDFPRPPILSSEGDIVRFEVGRELLKDLQELSRRNNATLFSVLLAGFYIFLHKQSNQEDFIVGVPTAGRVDSSLEKLVGMFFNTLPIRARVVPDLSAKTLLEEIHKLSTGAVENQQYIYEDLIYNLNLKRNADRSILFDILFKLQNITGDAVVCDVATPETEFHLGELTLKTYPFKKNRAKHDLTLEILDRKDYLECYFEYGTKLFRQETILRFAEHLIQIYTAMANNIHIAVKDINPISEQEKKILLERFNDTCCDYEEGKTIPGLFQEQVKKTPDAIAVKYKGKSITYKELNERANRIAWTLAGKGVGADDAVGIMADRSIEMIAGIYGILKAGAAYLPIDPRYPKDRIEYMILNSGAKVLLSEIPETAIEYGVPVLPLGNPDHFEENICDPEKTCGDRNLAYIIYTSGTTGRPKGVMIEHRSIINRIRWMQKAYPITEKDIILQKTTYTFDVSVWEILWWSMEGASVVMLPQGEEKDPQAIARAVEEEHITVMHFVPSMLNMFLKYVVSEGAENRLASLRNVFASGEALQKAYSDLFYERLTKNNHSRLINVYGPTEAAVDVTWYDMEENHASGQVYIGKPIDNIRIYIIDPYNHLLPIGVPGELCIAGIGLARGYINNKELTDEKFIDNPFRPGEKMYKTGDIARWTEDGFLAYIGRMDNQVKIRGFRIELEEIENVLLHGNEVKEAVVVAQQMKEEKCICAYYVSDKKLRAEELKAAIQRKLPEYMVPSYFIPLREIPITGNGKLDRKALPMPDAIKVSSETYVKPENELQRYLAFVWEDVLGVGQIGIKDNFFELGAHSLHILEVQTRIHKDKGIKIALHDMFRLTAIEALEEFIKKSGKTDFNTIEPISRRDSYEVSSGQKRLLILHELNPEDISYNLVSAYDIRGILDKEKLEKTFQQLFTRHEVFRTRFIHDADDYKQIIEEEAKVPIHYVSCGEEELDHAIHAAIRNFDLFCAPLAAIHVFELSDERNILVLNVHHIIADGVSLSILVREFVACYNGQPLEACRIQYKDYAAWQNRMLEDNHWKEQEEYWLSVYKDEIPPLNLPTDYPRGAVRSDAGSSCCFTIDQELKDKISELAMRTGTTTFMVLLAGYHILLGKYTNQEDLVIGTPISGRTHEDIRNTVGMFINVLPIRNKPEYNKTFASFLNEVKESSLRGYENQDYPFEKLIEKLNISGGLERNSLIEVLFAMENIGDTAISIHGLQFDEYRVPSTACQYDICLYAKETPDSIEFMLQYSKALFHVLTMKRFCNNLIRLLECIVEYPGYEIKQLHYIDEQEKNILLNQFNDTISDYPAGKTLQGLFEEQAAKTPDHIAVNDKGDSVTYQELNERANRIAWTLIKEGVKPDDIVGIMTDRHMEMIAGIYGILKAGAAYMPIDRSYPKDRIAYMVENSKANIILAQYAEEAEGYPVKTISLFHDAEWDEAAENPVIASSDTNLAYVIYTSGTTGKPKGVMIEHRSIVNRIHWMQKEYPLKETDVILQKTTYTFDVSVWEIIWWSLTGASVKMLPQGDEKDPEAIVKNIEEGHVTVMHFVPSMLSMFLTHVITEACYREISSLVYVFVSGEALQKVQCDSFYREITLKNKTQLVNLYGPTEAAVDVTFFNCALHPDASEIYIGKPIDNIKLYILDQNRKLVPIGVAGELCISGIGVARGYINNEKLTNEKFLENPYLSGERIYTTGDLARWKDDGNIEYLGRMDNQVKIRGFRIELGEIENVLLAVEGIKEAAVIAREENGEKYICAYYVSDREMTLHELRNALMNKLPEYMIPSYFVSIQGIPVTNNGKLNRQALPVPENISLREEGYQAPETATEQIVAKIWQEVLGLEKIGRGDNFFQLGGHSLKATLVLTRLRKKLQVNVMLKEIFQYSVLKDFAQYIDGLDTSEVYHILPGGDRTSYPVTSEQLGIYLASAKGSTNYNITFVSEITGALNREKVHAVLNTIVRRHKTLRTCFVFEDGALVQKVSDRMLDISMVEAKNTEEKKRILDHLAQPFDLSTGPLFRCVIVKEAENQYSLGFDMHHIIFDGYSISNFIKEFTQLYENQTLSDLPISYGDYALWQKDFTESEVFKKQEAYWMGKFTDQVPKLRLPADYESDGHSFIGDRVFLELPFAELLKLTEETGTTLFMILLSAYFIVLQKYTGQEDIVVGVPVMGRRNNDLQELLGMFVKSIPIRCCPEMSKRYRVFLEEVKESVFDAFENQDYTFGELPGKLGLKREEQAGLFSTMFILQNIEYPEMKLEGLTIENYPVYNRGAKYPIELFVNQKEEAFMLELNYAAQLFDEDSMRNMLNDYEKIIRCILADMDIPISDIHVVDEEEIASLREDINAVTQEMGMDFVF